MQFQVFYGEYNVMYGPNGVDLSAFKRTSSGIDKPLERSFGSICKWLQRGFHVDPLTHMITVHSLVNWEVQSELWELMMIHSTDDWQKYMQAALERGWPLAILVQTREKTQNEIKHGADQATLSIQRDGADQATPSIQRGGADQATPSIQRETNYIEQDESEEIENPNIGPQGLAGEGERIHSIVDEMEAEDQAAMEMEEYEGSSDDEQYFVVKQLRYFAVKMLSLFEHLYFSC